MTAWALAAIAASLPITRQGAVVAAAAASPAFILHNRYNSNNPRGIKQRALEVRPRSNRIILPSRSFASSGSSDDDGGTNDVAEAVVTPTETSTTASNDPAIPSLYDMLDISSTATRAEVKRSYLALAKETHPDAPLQQQQQQTSSSSSSSSSTTFTDIAKAYQILYDPILRKRYDRTLSARTFSVRASTIFNEFMNNAVMKLDEVLPSTDVDGVVAVAREKDDRSSSVSGGGVTSQRQVPMVASAMSTASAATANVFETIINSRYACTRFRRHDDESLIINNINNNNNTTTQASSSMPQSHSTHPSIVQLAYQCLRLSTRSPTGFNAQPYRIILVHSRQDRANVARYCLGRNADRVRDSDCTAIFVADGECCREWHARHVDLLRMNTTTRRRRATTTTQQQQQQQRSLTSRGLLKLRCLMLLFSSGYPLPRFIRLPLSSFVRLSVSIMGGFARLLKRYTNLTHIQLLPTLASSESWSQKNTMLIAMSYMLACTSHGLATCPMEGYDARGIKMALGITPSGRYSIPLIVSTGLPYQRMTREEEEDETDDVGLSHGRGRENMSPRYPMENVIFGNAFGVPAIETF